MAEDYNELLNEAEVIRTNELPSSNTAQLVGGHLKKIIKYTHEGLNDLGLEVDKKVSELSLEISGEAELYRTDFGTNQLEIKELPFTLVSGEEYTLSISMSNSYSAQPISLSLSINGSIADQNILSSIKLNGKSYEAKITPTINAEYIRCYCEKQGTIEIKRQKKIGLKGKVEGLENILSGFRLIQVAENGFFVADAKFNIGLKLDSNALSSINIFETEIND